MEQDTAIFSIDPSKEVRRITSFLQRTLRTQKKEKVIIAVSGGIDSTTALFLLARAITPHHVLAVSLPYFPLKKGGIEQISEKLRTRGKLQIISIKKTVDALASSNGIAKNDTVRLGNVMARVRMTYLYDLAKKNNALVCGTENKSEYYLGYFTRFGDEASDIEPIRHLYKTQVYQLARFLDVPNAIINKAPTAGLWFGQTDEKEFGFSYEEADQVLYYYFKKKLPLKTIEKKGLKNAANIIERVKKNDFKHHVPYILSH